MMKINLKLLVSLVVIIPVITTGLTYGFTIALKQTNNQIIPFISTTLDTPPGSCIGTGGLSITSTIIIILTMIRMVYVKAWVKRTGLSVSVDTLNRLNIAGAVTGIGFALCLVGVISVQWNINHNVHNSFSSALFLLGTFYMCIQTAVDFLMYRTRSRISKWQTTLRVACSILGVVLYVPRIYFPYCIIYLFDILGAVVEIVMALLFLSFYCSFHVEWHALGLVVDIQWDELLPLIAQSTDS